MELYGVVSNQMFSGMKMKMDSSSNLVVIRPSNSIGLGFRDNSHLGYYYHHHKSRLTCVVGGGGKKKEEVDVLMTKNKKKEVKKKLNFLNGLAVVLPQHQSKLFSEATELLLGQLQQLKVEEMELKRKRKQDKARIKAARKQSKMGCCESSTSSSESSDSECGEVINTCCLKTDTLARPTQNVTTNPKTTFMLPSQLLTAPAGKIIEIQPQDFTQEGTAYNGVKVSLTTGDLEELTSTVVKQSPMSLSPKKIEVCLGGKCKKSGSALLLEEFQKVVGAEGLVMGCKCMGKCKVGPNVRVHQHPEMEGSVCSGVGLEDVGLIMSNFYGGKAESDSGVA